MQLIAGIALRTGERGRKGFSDPGAQMLPADVQVLSHCRDAGLIGKPADHRIADLFVEVMDAADERVDIARRDRSVAELPKGMQSFGEQIFLAAEDAQHSS